MANRTSLGSWTPGTAPNPWLWRQATEAGTRWRWRREGASGRRKSVGGKREQDSG